MKVPGSASFKLGEEVLVFLEKVKQKSYHMVMGMSYGKYKVLEHPKTKIRYLTNRLKVLVLFSCSVLLYE